jgi:hypothetical protein
VLYNLYLPKSEWLVPTLWSLRLISAPSHRPSTSKFAKLRLVLSQSKPRLELCRWLGGSVQRIHTPYFIWSTFIATAISLNGFCLNSLLILYQSWLNLSRQFCNYLHFL